MDYDKVLAVLSARKRTKMQVKHISDEAVITLIKSLSKTTRIYWTDTGYTSFETTSASWYDIQKLWDNVPPKLILAKLRNMEKRGIIDGCPCGCIGSFTVI